MSVPSKSTPLEDITIRVSQAERNAVLDWFQTNFGRPCSNETAISLAAAVVTANDYLPARYCVWTRDPRGEIYVFGPYAGRKTAENVMATGLLASMEGTKGVIAPLVIAPRNTFADITPYHYPEDRPAPKKGTKK